MGRADDRRCGHGDALKNGARARPEVHECAAFDSLRRRREDGTGLALGAPCLDGKGGELLIPRYQNSGGKADHPTEAGEMDGCFSEVAGMFMLDDAESRFAGLDDAGLHAKGGEDGARELSLGKDAEVSRERLVPCGYLHGRNLHRRDGLGLHAEGWPGSDPAG